MAFPEAILLRGAVLRTVRANSAGSALASGEVRQMADGRAGVFVGGKAAAANDGVEYAVDGIFNVLKSTSITFLPGQEVWWDATNNVATYQGAGDFYMGLCAETDTVSSSAAGTYIAVDLNAKQHSYKIDFNQTGAVMALTAAATSKIMCGELDLQVIATNEAECADALSSDSIAKTARGIFEGEVNFAVAAGTATDFSFGIANATSTTDADAITEHVLFHVDGNDTKIYAQSKDGTTTVTATDTTKTYATGTRKFFQLDARDPASVKLYINGVRVLSATTFVLTAATGPFKLLAHIEKTSSTNTGQMKVIKARGYTAPAA